MWSISPGLFHEQASVLHMELQGMSVLAKTAANSSLFSKMAKFWVRFKETASGRAYSGCQEKGASCFGGVTIGAEAGSIRNSLGRQL
jgi:hypothetical protein